MRQRTPTLNGRPIDTIPYLKAEDLGKAREHLHFRNGRLAKNSPQDEQKEVFCSIDKLGAPSKCFWMQRTNKLQEFFNYLIQENRSNQHITFIPWDDRVNCVVCDGIYISQTNFFMTKEEFKKFCETIVPFDQIDECYYGKR